MAVNVRGSQRETETVNFAKQREHEMKYTTRTSCKEYYFCTVCVRRRRCKTTSRKCAIENSES